MDFGPGLLKGPIKEGVGEEFEFSESIGTRIIFDEKPFFQVILKEVLIISAVQMYKS